MADTKTAGENVSLLHRRAHRGVPMIAAARKALSAFVALLALVGCKPVGMPVQSASAKSASPATSLPVLAIENLVTLETAGKSTLALGFGEPVSLRKGGMTLVLTPKSLVKLDGDPSDLSSYTRPGNNCHAWWKLSYEVVVDAQPDAEWKDWMVAFKGFDVLQQSRDFPYVPADDFGSGPDQLLKLTAEAEYERSQNHGAPYRKTLESKQYADMCADGLSDKPSGLEPFGVELSASALRDFRDRAFLKPIARWLL